MTIKVANIDFCSRGPALAHDWSGGQVCRACGESYPDSATQFAQRLDRLLNAHSQENASNTPDFILAQYLLGCLALWNTTTQQRETWYGRDASLCATAGVLQSRASDVGDPQEPPQ